MRESIEHSSIAVAEAGATKKGLAPGEIIIGTLAAIDADGHPLVSYLQSACPQCRALSTVAVLPQHIGRQVALLFIEADIQKPLIIGFVHSALNDLLDNFIIAPAQDNLACDHSEDITVFENPLLNPGIATVAQEVRVDGKKVVVEAEDEIMFKCGEASITLTKAGKIMIRGKYVLSRASGVNRILGGSVSVN